MNVETVPLLQAGGCPDSLLLDYQSEHLRRLVTGGLLGGVGTTPEEGSQVDTYSESLSFPDALRRHAPDLDNIGSVSVAELLAAGSAVPSDSVSTLISTLEEFRETAAKKGRGGPRASLTSRIDSTHLRPSEPVNYGRPPGILFGESCTKITARLHLQHRPR